MIALIRASASAAEAQQGLIDLLEIDEIQAGAILDMQLRKLAALERQALIDEYDELMAQDRRLYRHPRLARRGSGRSSEDELDEIVDKFGDDRRTKIIPYDRDVSMEDLIAEEDVVVTITRGGYASGPKTDLYRAQRRARKGGARRAVARGRHRRALFVTTTHHRILFFTNKGGSTGRRHMNCRNRPRETPGASMSRTCSPFSRTSGVAEVLYLRDYEIAPYLVLATHGGLVKKSRLTEFDSPRAGGIIAINLRDDDEVISARLVDPEDDLLLISRRAQAIRFHASDDALRPMGRATSGVIGMRFVDGDELLGMHVVQEDEDVLVATEGGYAKRTPANQYPVQNRGGRGVVTAKIVDARGGLVGALMVRPEDEVFAITWAGGVIRTRAGGSSYLAARQWGSG